MKSFLSINEFSKLSGLEVTTLRYWDNINLFLPAMRNPDNNYRYYSPEQLVTVKFINVMSSLGVPLKELAVIKREQEPKKVSALLAKQSRKMNEELRRLQEALAVINERQNLIGWGTEILDGVAAVEGTDILGTDKTEKIEFKKISVFRREAVAFIRGPRNIWKENGGRYDSFVNFLNHAKELRINMNLPIGGIHNSWEHFMESPGEPDYFFSADINGNMQQAAGCYMFGFARGDYGDFGNLNERMSDFAAENSLRVSGPVYSVYLHDEICHSDSSQFLSQVFVAVSR